VSAEESATIELWDGVPEAEGAVELCTYAMPAGQLVPLALLSAWSSEGRPVYLRSVDSVQIDGRAVHSEV
jgi:hypothetical protein